MSIYKFYEPEDFELARAEVRLAEYAEEIRRLRAQVDTLRQALDDASFKQWMDTMEQWAEELEHAA